MLQKSDKCSCGSKRCFKKPRSRRKRMGIKPAHLRWGAAGQGSPSRARPPAAPPSGASPSTGRPTAPSGSAVLKQSSSLTLFGLFRFCGIQRDNFFPLKYWNRNWCHPAQNLFGTASPTSLFWLAVSQWAWTTVSSLKACHSPAPFCSVAAEVPLLGEPSSCLSP